MSQEQWKTVDDYFIGLLHPADSVLEDALQAAADAGLPSIQVAANQGKMLQIFAQSMGARSILEIGTLGGYSTIWLARALPADGKLITLEIDPKHAEVASKNIANAGLSNIVEVRLGSAHDSLPQIAAENLPPFDLVFIDADKSSTPVYLDWALKLTRPGSLIIIDNVVRGGAVADPTSTNVDVNGVQKALAAVASNPNLTATAVQTVGGKSYDGFALIWVKK